jgi:hypothetical protein
MAIAMRYAASDVVGVYQRSPRGCNPAASVS